MTLDEALSALGVTAADLKDEEADARADKVRRAYLRAVRRASPERDPAGFQRVRAAFERLQVEIGEAQAGGGWASPATPRSPVVPEPATDEGPLSAWQQHHRVQYQECEPALLVDSSLGSRLAVALAMIERGEIDAGLVLAEFVFDAASLSASAEDAELSAVALVDAQLLLLRAGRIDAAQYLASRVVSWLEEGRAVAMLGDQGERWMYTVELVWLPRGFSEKLRVRLAGALLADEQGGLRRVMTRHPILATRSSSLLRRHAPLLFEIYEANVDRLVAFADRAYLVCAIAMILGGVIALRCGASG